MLLRDWMRLPVWDTADPAGGGAPTALAAAAAAADPKAAAAADPAKAAADPAKADPAKADPAAATPYYPQGLPDAVRGKTDRETLDKIAEEYGKRPKAPDKPDGYTLKLSDDFTKSFGDLKDDKVLPLWREIAHGLGLSDDQFNGSIDKLYGAMRKAGLIDDPISVDAELKKLEPSAGDQKQRSAAATARVNAAVDWVRGLATREFLSKEQAAKAVRLAEDAVGITLLEKFKEGLGTTGLVGGGVGGGGDNRTAHEKQLQAMYPSLIQN